MKTKRFKIAFVALALCTIAGGGLSSCSTTKGFGRDLQKLGTEIEQEANQHL
ncbi:MAG: hypothetical protein R3F19_14290 [Verrucomicrobiales bacterium]|nr:entericidin EcnAB [Verrucomicrobiae bacterium]